MTQAWPTVVGSPQGRGSWPEGLMPRPEQLGVPPGLLYECREGKLSFPLRAAELGCHLPQALCWQPHFLYLPRLVHRRLNESS